MEPRLLVDALYTNSNIHLPIIHVPNDGVRHSFTLACWLMFAFCAVHGTCTPGDVKTCLTSLLCDLSHMRFSNKLSAVEGQKERDQDANV